MSIAPALSGKVAYQLETNFDQAVAATRYLWNAHWTEIASYRDVRAFDPNLAQRRRLLELNMLMVFTARQDGRVVGYIDWVIFPDPQARLQLTAETDVYYVEPRRDRALIMLRLMRKSLEHLAERKVIVARPRTKLKAKGPGRGAGVLWRRCGFAPYEIIYAKVLQRGD